MSRRNVKILFDETNINFFAWSGVYIGFVYSPNVIRFVGGKLNGCVTRIENDHGYWGVDLKNWDKLGKIVQAKLQKGELDAEDDLKSLKDIGLKLFRHADKIIGKDLSKVSNKQLVNWLKYAWKNNVELNGAGFLGVVSDFEHNYLSSNLSAILEKRSTKKNPTQSFLSKLISPDQPDLNWQEYLELLKVVKKYKTLKRIKKSREFQTHIKKYNWLNYGFQGPVWTESDFVGRIKVILSEKPIENQLFEHLNNFKQIKREQAALEKKFRLSDHEKYLFKSARILMFTKAFRVNVRHKIQYAFDLVFQELGKRFYQSIYFFRYARIEEIVDLINGKKLDTTAILARRKLMLEIIDNGKRQFIPTNKIARIYNKLLVKEKKITGNSLQGHSAYIGIARGKAKLVFGLNDLAKVKNGDILIAISTTPDLLPAMVKAAAFVTDQGGITSHAAIVARELKKPCIIGTKLATKIFKDGDMVEVDANKGVVRKI